MKLISIPANPVPEDVVTGTLKTPDGAELRFARWAPPPGRKGTVCLFHGRAEFIEKYYEMVRDLRARGFAVATLDWRGQGLSHRSLRDARKGHVSDFSDYDMDLETFMQNVVLPDCPPPYFGLAHSMGASVLLRAAHKGRRWFDRMMMCAPLLALGDRPLLGFAPVVARLMRYSGMGRSYIPTGTPVVISAQPFVGNRFTSDPVRHARTAAVLEAEPGLGIGSPTVAWADSAFRAMSQIMQPSFAASIRMPIVMVAAGRDEIVSMTAIEQFAKQLRSGSHLIIAGARHEIMMEQDHYRAQFLAAFDAFVPGTPVFR
ncbi:MAG: alpha/beta hydrolase [Rhizobiales bacterium]|nr:alpha/beta hydrolase [Hyphomicrobiales bacterium]